jgi:hypothetical protein
MRRISKIKTLASRVAVRKSALSASAAARRPFPAWIVADDCGIAFTAKAAVMPRVRDGLVLRPVSKNNPVSRRVGAKGAQDDHRAR